MSRNSLGDEAFDNVVNFHVDLSKPEWWKDKDHSDCTLVNLRTAITESDVVQIEADTNQMTSTVYRRGVFGHHFDFPKTNDFPQIKTVILPCLASVCLLTMLLILFNFSFIFSIRHYQNRNRACAHKSARSFF